MEKIGWFFNNEWLQRRAIDEAAEPPPARPSTYETLGAPPPDDPHEP